MNSERKDCLIQEAREVEAEMAERRLRETGEIEYD